MDQKRTIEEGNQEPIMTYNQTDFIKDRVAVEVQFGNILCCPRPFRQTHVFLYQRQHRCWYRDCSNEVHGTVYVIWRSLL